MIADLIDRFRAPLGHLRLAKHWEGEPTQCAPLWQRAGICRSAFEMLPYLRPNGDIEYIRKALTQPDEPDLRGVVAPDVERGSTVREACEGSPERFRKWFPIRLRAIRLRELKMFGLEEMEEVE
jgi:hypothetical protein